MADKIISLPIHFFNIQNINKDERLMSVKLYAVAEGLNRNDSSFTIESIIKALGGVINTPILAQFDEKKNDVLGHELELKYDTETNEYYYDFQKGERIIGIIPLDSKIEIEELNGKKWLTYTGYIFTNYNHQIKKMLENIKTKKISVEIKVNSSYMDGNIEIIEDFTLLGTTLLGEKISEGIPGAHLDLMQFSQKNLNNFSKSLSFALNKTDNKIEDELKIKNNQLIMIPNDIKEIIKNQMEIMKDYPMNTTEQITTAITARDLLVNHQISIEQGEEILKKIDEFESDIENNAKQALVMLLGGKAMKDFLQKTFDYKFQDKTLILKNTSDISDIHVEEIKEEDKVVKKEFSVGEDLGKSSSITIKNSKESAVNGAWSDPGATMLNKLLKASNHASLVKEAYLMIDEDNSSDLSINDVHYPHHHVVGDTLVVHIRGCQAALSRARAQGIKGAPINHLKKHYKALGLDMKNFKDFGLSQKDFEYLFDEHIKYTKKEDDVLKDKVKTLENEKKYKVMGYDEKNLCAYDIKGKKIVTVPYSITDDRVVMDEGKAKDAKLLCQYDNDENDGNEDDIKKKEFGCHEEMGKVFESLIGMEEKTLDEEKKFNDTKKAFDEDKKAFDEEKQVMETEKLECEAKKLEMDETKKAFDEEKKSLEEKIKTMEDEKLKTMEELKKYKAVQFDEIVSKYSKLYSMSTEEIQDWSTKSKTFEDVVVFEKELMFAFKEKQFNKDNSHIQVGFVNKPEIKKSKSAIERLRESK